MNRTKAWLWRQAASKARAIEQKRNVRQAVREWAVMARLALGDDVPLRDVLQAANADVDAVLNGASVSSSDGVVKALASHRQD